jgi:hypothetical protein
MLIFFFRFYLSDSPLPPSLCTSTTSHVIFALLLLSIRYRDPRFLPYIQCGVVFAKKRHLCGERSKPLQICPAKVGARRDQRAHNFIVALPRSLPIDQASPRNDVEGLKSLT